MFIVILCLIVLVSEYAYHRTQFVSLVKCIVQIMFFFIPLRRLIDGITYVNEF